MSRYARLSLNDSKHYLLFASKKKTSVVGGVTMNKGLSQGPCLTWAIYRTHLMESLSTALLWGLVIAITFLFLAAGPAHADKTNVTLNGYTFSDDSINLWENQYFSTYYTANEPCLYYGSWIYLGYGDFSNDYVADFFDKIEPYKTINCVVYREHGFWEGKWIEAVNDTQDSPRIPGYYMGERYTRYNYLAKDTDGNIHILQSLRPNETDLDDAGIIEEGGTTLMYPNAPAFEQPVYGGYVAGVDTSNLQITRWINYELGSDLLAPIVITLQPGVGVVQMTYNWHDKKDGYPDATSPADNGFLMDTTKNTYSSKPNYTPNNVVIHGYTFDASSPNIWENQYFGSYTLATINGYTKVLYGYGDFKSYDIGIYFDSFSTADNVNCVVMRQHGYMPGATTTTDATTGKSVTTFTFTPYTEYDYLAKDIAGNIHLLRSVNGSDDLNADAITANGGTTLLYPGTPAENQLVSDGMVVGLNSAIDIYTGCMSIRRGSSPDITFDYYKPSSGLVTSVYNWGSSTNGFSLNKNPQITSLPAAGGTNTDTVNTDPATSTGNHDKNKMWYQCFIETSTYGNNSANEGGMILLIMVTIISLRAALGVVRK
jgi:hypothetical protein